MFRGVRVHAGRRRLVGLSYAERSNGRRVELSGRLHALRRLELLDRRLSVRTHDPVDGSGVIALIVQCMLRRTDQRLLVVGCALRCGLGRTHVQVPAVRERVVATLANVATELAERLAFDLGMTVPMPLPTASKAEA